MEATTVTTTDVFRHFSDYINKTVYRRENFYLSVISASGLLHGIYMAKNLAIRNKRRSFVEDIQRKVPVLSIDSSIARIHAEIWAELLDS